MNMIYLEFGFIDYGMMTFSPSLRISSAGFTLIELLMAISIISILAVVGVTQFSDFGTDAKKALTMEKLMALKVAIDGDPHFYAAGEFSKAGFQANCGAAPAVALPATAAQLTDLITMPSSGTCATVYDPFTKLGWRGPYVSTTDSSWNKDAWGTYIEYSINAPLTIPATGTLLSCGPDLTCGNSDDISVTF